MKIRFGHVTNSSSSSYVIAFDSPTSKTISTVEALKEHMRRLKRREYDVPDEQLESYREYKDGVEFINEGKHVVLICVSYDEPVDLEVLFEDLGINAYVRELPL